MEGQRMARRGRVAVALRNGCEALEADVTSEKLIKGTLRILDGAHGNLMWKAEVHLVQCPAGPCEDAFRVARKVGIASPLKVTGFCDEHPAWTSW